MKGALLDSLQGFLAGLLDGWTRPLIGLLAMPMGMAVFAWPLGPWVLMTGILGYPFAFMAWSAWGVMGWIIGFLLALTIGVSFICFWAERSSKKSWYILWSTSCFYYAIFMKEFFNDTDFENRWIFIAVSVVIFTSFTFFYWLGPRLLARLLKKLEPNEPEEDEAEES